MSLLTEANDVLDALSEANRKFSSVYPGDRPARQPVHTVYGGAQLYKAETTQRLGELALRSLDRFAPDALALARGVGFASPAALAVLAAQDLAQLRAELGRDRAALRQRAPEAWLVLTVHDRVRAKLAREPVEDFR